MVRSAAGRTVIRIGNRPNLRGLWDLLGPPGEPPMTYGDLVVVEPDPNGGNRVAERRIVPVGT